MKGFTSEWLAARQAIKANVNEISESGNDPESELQRKIIEYCNQRHWPYFNSRMDVESNTTMLGVPDFIIASDGGVTHWIECKRGKNKLSEDQEIFATLLRNRGHNPHVVRSMKDFICAIAEDQELWRKK